MMWPEAQGSIEVLEARLLGDLVLALVGVVLEVSDVGDVAHVTHLVTQGLEVAEQQVEGDRRACVAQVGVAIDRGAADIHAYMLGVDGLEGLLAARERIVQIEFAVHVFHSLMPSCAVCRALRRVFPQK